MIQISIEEKINEYINRNRGKKTKKSVIEPINENISVPSGYTGKMFKELKDVGFSVKPFKFQDAKFQESKLPQGGISLKNLIETLSQITDPETMAEYENMRRLQNPLLFGKMRWIILAFLLFMMISLLIAWI
ncbi:MAG: hypothetical protein HWN67_04385 [Candidatus Helarchaeota archaeon]|nr:hypothetical protein [Candidatus Helarchaeota archaeon]